MTKQTRFINPSNPKQGFDAITQVMRDMYVTANGKPLVVTIDIDDDSRSTKQNRLLWMWHSELSEHIKEHQGGDYGSETIHIYVVEELLPMHVIETPKGPKIDRTQTSKLGVKPMARFLTRYEMWAADKYECNFTQPQDLYIEAIMRGAE